MKHLSSIADTYVTVSKGYAYFKVGEYPVTKRKITSKDFSNWPVDTIQYENETYLLDSKLVIDVL